MTTSFHLAQHLSCLDDQVLVSSSAVGFRRRHTIVAALSVVLA